jgi:hypothetical protein
MHLFLIFCESAFSQRLLRTKKFAVNKRQKKFTILAENAPLSELIDTENISLPSQNMKFGGE